MEVMLGGSSLAVAVRVLSAEVSFNLSCNGALCMMCSRLGYMDIAM